MCFASTGLFGMLIDLNDKLVKENLFIIGDAAHPLCGFLITPFANPGGASTEDDFNFWQSNSRIRIECAFGELVMRWGIFWRSLKFDLPFCGKIISGAMLLHNFLVDMRDGADLDFFASFSVKTVTDEDCGHGPADEIPLAIVTDNNAPRPPGSKKKDEIECNKEGQSVREVLRGTLDTNDMKRPMRSGMK